MSSERQHAGKTNGTRRILSAGYTQVPNLFIDRLMPRVRPAYFKVLIFIWRKTVGWQKQRDYISLTQIQSGAGVCRATAISGLKFWKQVGLIRPTNRSGIRGTIQYEVVRRCDEEAVTSRLGQLVDERDQFNRNTSTGSSGRTSLVHNMNTQKTASRKTGKESRRGAAAAPAAPASEWQVLGLGSRIGTRPFQQMWVSAFINRNGRSLSDVMEECIQVCQDNDIRVPRPFFEAKRLVEQRERDPDDMPKLEVPD